MITKFSSIFNNLGLAKKLNFLLFLIFIVGIIFSGIALANTLNQKARNEISSNAGLLIQTLNSVRSYTNSEVSPQLGERLQPDEFSANVVPSFAARKVFEKLQMNNIFYKNFIYKEAMINPTNILDKADSFELEIITSFRKNNNLNQEMTGFRSLKGQDLFYIAHPLAITEAKCLRCHSTPDKAPKSMIQKYGTINGMGWKLNDINGAQIVFLPSEQIFRNARQSSVFLIGLIAVIFALAIFTANFWIKQFIVKPIKKVAQIAEAVSIGDMDAEFEKLSNDEIGSLAEAFTRMKISLTMAMKRFKS